MSSTILIPFRQLHEAEEFKLLVDDESNIDRIASLHQHLANVKRQAGMMLDILEERIKQMVIETGRPVEWTVNDLGDVRRFYLGHSKSIKCRSVADLLMFMAENFSYEDLADCLSANAIKHGTFRKLLQKHNQADKFEQFFETIIKDKLETGEPAPKEIQSFDTRYGG